ncbi:MAG TPA: alpha-hydroxy acid oxidase [Dehalococcoidia bacterium]|nr:alpha-hydroxy acid oxidase [Dehalococcoidia bacterium]
MTDAERFQTTQEIVQAARRNLSQPAWDYLVGASESETTMRRNRLAFDKLGFVPRVLVDVSSIDPSTTLLGMALKTPVVLAPIGSMQHLSPDGAIGFAKAAAAYGTVMSMSIMTPPSLEDVAASTDAPKIFQLYVQGDLAWAKDTLDRVRAAGYAAVCLTVDTPYHSRRDRSILNPMPGRRPASGGHRGPNFGAAVTWDTVAKLREMARLPFILKGIMNPADALLAAEMGIDAIWVSNHGGRQLDQSIGTMDMLPRIVEAVGGRAEIVVDGGVLRGTDVLKAIALGAKAVGIGKLQGWGMAAGGVDGLVRTLELLEEEIVMAMALVGVTCLDQLDSSYVEKTDPVYAPHEMSMWGPLTDDRIV